jgi:Flp pilus assembly protein TadD
VEEEQVTPLFVSCDFAQFINFREQPVTRRRRTTLLLAALLAISGTTLAIIFWRRAPGTDEHISARAASAGAKARPSAGYVGDAACTRCHRQIALTYSRHPMGNSLSPVAAAPPAGDEAGGRPLFEAQGLAYSIERRDGRVVHQETRRDSSGAIVARNEAEVRFALGSGHEGIGYLVERDGFLFQSPISWYVRKRQWDLAPGYERMNAHFDRPVASTCLYCHANRALPVAGTINRYRPPIFQGHAIGCERCHGPGELHVQARTKVDSVETTIVNPAGLEPALRDAVCEQCHLLGHRRVVKRDRREEDFRPGLSFDEFWSVFEPAAGTAEERFVGQVEQMHESVCFQASRGGLGCISCHDPHERPGPAEQARHYRERCLECHADRGCKLPESARLARSGTDDCAGCHMPRLDRTDILHAATTDHRILRQSKGADRPSISSAGPSAGAGPLVLFHRERMSDRQRKEAERDLGVALCRDGPAGAAAALPLLDAALVARPDDLDACEAKGFALVQLGRYLEGLAAFRSALGREPGRESALIGAADAAARAGRRDDAIADLRRAIALNPNRAAYRSDLASLYFRARDWPAAASAAREALRSSPIDVETRRILVRSYLHLRDSQAARRELDTLLRFDPPDRDELMRWLGPLSEPR